MRRVGSDARDVAGAREEIFGLIRRNPNSNIIIHFAGWAGFGVAAVLRSIARTLPSMEAPPPRLCFGRTIYIDCSRWVSRRAMQKKIAQELGLDHKTMAIFEEQDEEDDFNGVDHGSRDAIRSVAAVIDRALRETRFMMIFINGSDDEIILSRLGVPETSSDYVIIWTFSARFVTMHPYHFTIKIAEKLRYTDVFLYCYGSAINLPSSKLIALFREEAANIVARGQEYMRGMDLSTKVVDCCLYGLLLHYHSCRHSNTGFIWPAHTPSFWICDGIIQGDRAWETSKALHPEISFECDASVLDYVFRSLKEDVKTPFLVVSDGDDVHGDRAYRWISVTLKKKKINEGMQTIFARASSIFLAFETKGIPFVLPNSIFKECSKLSVLVLSCCSFSFLSPPFLHCPTLKFLGLDHCKDNRTINVVEHEGVGCATNGWACLQSLWVIDLYYTDWVDMLSKEKLELMTNLMELNIEGVRWPRWWTNHQSHQILPNLQRLRIIRPIYDEAAETTSSDISHPFLIYNSNLEVLDLSGSNKGIGTNLPASILKASHLQVLILDGCHGLEDVVVSNNSSLRSFSFDGYGPASHRTSTLQLPSEESRPKHSANADKIGVPRTSIISLNGCTQLENLFLRGLSNLVELDLSGCKIKVLDFGSTVVDVPMLKRLFLLGCERLRAIKWGTNEQQPKPQLELELICIDTRPESMRVLGCSRPSSLRTQQKSSGSQLQVTTTDARLIRSLLDPVVDYITDFNICITSSPARSDGIVHPEAAASKGIMIGSTGQRNYAVAAKGLYGDIFIKVGDDLAPMQDFPHPSMRQLDRHIEIGDGSHNVQSEVEAGSLGDKLGELMARYAESLHVHDVSTCSNVMPLAGLWNSLVSCHVERCPNLHAIFPQSSEDNSCRLETIWASDLLMARCVWSKGISRWWSSFERFSGLQHLYLCRCPSLQFGLAMGSRPSFPRLEILHIIHCGGLKHVFVPGDEENRHPSVEFPTLTTIHLYDMPALQQICEAAEMLAPKLETIRIRGCWSLRRLPALKGREAGMRRPAVEHMEKDVWDALEWDGVDAGHHPSLYEAPVHSRHYRRRRMLRGTVLR